MGRDRLILEHETFDMRNLKTGEFECTEHLWVPLRARKKGKAHHAAYRKKATRIQKVNNRDVAAVVLFELGQKG